MKSMKPMDKIAKGVAKGLAPALLLASSALLLAQEGEPMKAYVSFGQNFAQNHALSLAGKTWGGPGCYHAEFGLEFYHPASTLLVRPNAGYTRMLSQPGDTFTDRDEDGTLVYHRAPTVYDLMAVFVGFDLVYNVSKKLPITAVTGPSIHYWTVQQSNNVPLGVNLDKMGDTKPKLGWRIGLGYDFKVREYPLRVDFTYTLAEWRSKSSFRETYLDEYGVQRTRTVNYREGLNPSFPTFFTLKATYTF
jgi:hypothetical protein